MGGDEFAMAVSGAKAIDRAAAFAWAALELLKAPVTLSKRKIYIGASIGIASGAPGGMFQYRAVSPGGYRHVPRQEEREGADGLV